MFGIRLKELRKKNGYTQVTLDVYKRQGYYVTAEFDE